MERTDINDLSFQTLSIKLSWYDNNNKIIGTFGCSVILKQQSIANCLSAALRLILPHNLLLEMGNKPKFNLSKRESQCLYLISRGNTAQIIADKIGLSRRTVGYYLEI